MAAGVLLGIVGVLIAVPLAAVIGILIRFAIGHYLGSSIYLGAGAGGSGPGPPSQAPTSQESPDSEGAPEAGA